MFALEGPALPIHPDMVEEVAETILARVPSGESPYLSELTTEHVHQPGYDSATSSSSGSI